MNKVQTTIFLGIIGAVSSILIVILLFLTKGQNLLNTPDLACLNKIGNPTLCTEFKKIYTPGDGKKLVYPASVGASKMRFDDEIAIYSYKDGEELTLDSYCYFVFNNTISVESVPVKKFGEIVTAFSIKSSDIHTYQAWLQSNLGASCAKLVQSELGKLPTDLNTLDGKSLVAFYPLNMLKKGMSLDHLKREVATAVNHERIHLMEEYCEGFSELQSEIFNRADPNDVAKIQTNHPSYNWGDPVEAAREYTAYKYERDPVELENGLECQ